MSSSTKLKKSESVENKRPILHSEIKSISVEDQYHKKSILMSFFSNILHSEELEHIKKPLVLKKEL